MNYRQTKNKISESYNNFPMFFAFSEKQFNEGKEKLGATSNKDLLSIGMGGYILKSDKDNFSSMIDNNHKLLNEFLKEKSNLIDALVYELGNHEYCITGDDEPTLEALGLDYKTMTDDQLEALKEAKRIYIEAS